MFNVGDFIFMKEIISFIYSDGKRIFTRLLFNEEKEKLPLVIFSHGLGANHRQEQKMQEELVKGGMAVLSFDFAGGAGFVESKSDGENKDMSVLTEIQNLKDVIKYALDLELINTRNLYLIGASQGGVVSMMVAKEMQEMISSIYLLYPALPLFEDGHQRYSRREDIAEETNLHGIMVGKKYFWDIHGMDVYEIIKDIDIKTHIFHGTKDKLVPMSYVDKAVDVLRRGSKSVIDGGEHGFKEDMQKKIARQILDEINKKVVL